MGVGDRRTPLGPMTPFDFEARIFRRRDGGIISRCGFYVMASERPTSDPYGSLYSARPIEAASKTLFEFVQIGKAKPEDQEAGDDKSK